MGIFQEHVAERDPVRSRPIFGYILLAAIVLGTWMTVELGNRLPRDSRGNRDYIVAAVPAFFMLMFVEAALLKLGAVDKSIAAQYTTADTWSSLAAGTAQQAWYTVARRFIPVALLYSYIYERYSVFHGLEGAVGWGPYMVTFVLGDFAYYWFHRHAHEVAFLWAGHSVHHSSEHYNLSTALRQSWLQSIVSSLWSLPLALFVPPSVFILASQWVTLYQFWVHTCVIRHMGIFEYIFVTPSHHRVHHDRRVHKNFAGVFIIWDRIFGTFHDELAHGATNEKPEGDETCYFGIKETISTWSEAATQFMMWEPIFRKGHICGPGWSTTTADRPLPAVASADILRLRVVESVGTIAKSYIVAQFLFSLFVFMRMAIAESQLTNEQVIIDCVICVASLVTQGLLLDGSLKSLIIELVRNIVLLYVAHHQADSVLMTFSAVSVIFIILFNNRVLGDGSCAPPKAKRD